MMLTHPLITVVGFTILIFATVYSILNVAAVCLWRLRQPTNVARPTIPVSILKPLCGAEPALYEHLHSFCEQNYPEFEIIFGVRDHSDPAVEVVRRLIAEFPTLSITLVVDSQLHGTNFKVSNLMNMLTHAHHDILVMSDSDARVGPTYLATVTAPLTDPRIGLVTCVYSGVPTATVWSRLGAMYINEWYIPSVLLSWMFGHAGYVSGQTMALRRETLDAIGGLRSITNDLADDYRLGALVRGLGLKIALSSFLVAGEHHEPSAETLVAHEVRWMSTIRVLKPRSFRWIFLTFTLPLALAGAALATSGGAGSQSVYVLLYTTVAARFCLHIVHRTDDARSMLVDLWLLPVRDALLCWVWFRSFLTSRIVWRGGEFAVDAHGVMRRLP